MTAEVALVGLVDARGWLLLQERDDQTRIDPDKWGLPGGAVEPGETPAEAAHRELAEETGLAADLIHLGTRSLPCAYHGQDLAAVFVARTDATDADVVCTEGRQIVFVDPDEVPGLDLTEATRATYEDVLRSAGSRTAVPRETRPVNVERMPIHRTDPPLVASEADTLRAYLAYHRDTMRMKTEGLDQAQLSQVHPPSALTLGGLLKHAALNDDWWFCRVFEGRETEPDWVPEGAFEADEDWELTSAKDDEPAELRRIFDETAAAADAAIERGLAKDGLDTLSVTPSRREGTPFSLRWIIVHMIEEYARHNGHADLLREAVDGQVGE